MKNFQWTTITCAAFLATVFACNKAEKQADESPSSAAKITTPTPETTKAEVGVPKADVPSPKYRVAHCDFVGFVGEGEERVASFRIKPIGDEEFSFAQAWIYYYDEAGKQLQRYPHALNGIVASKPLSLGSKGSKLPKATANAACEITEVTFADKSKWSNHNLLGSVMAKRPLEGYTDAQLAESAKVYVNVMHPSSVPTDKIMAKVENLSGRPIDLLLINTFYYDENKKLLNWYPTNLRVSLEAGATIEQEIGLEASKIPEKTRYVQSVAPMLVFKDGDEEHWENANIGHYLREMVESE